MRLPYVTGVAGDLGIPVAADGPDREDGTIAAGFRAGSELDPRPLIGAGRAAGGGGDIAYFGRELRGGGVRGEPGQVGAEKRGHVGDIPVPRADKMAACRVPLPQAALFQ